MPPGTVELDMSDSGEQSGGEAESRTGEKTKKRAGAGGRPCPLCETPMYHRHCKYVCPQHGVVYDCSDTFY